MVVPAFPRDSADLFDSLDSQMGKMHVRRDAASGETQGYLGLAQDCLWKEGRKDAVVAVPVTARKWLIGVKRSALETRFVLAEGTHQSRCLFGEFLAI